MSDFTNTSGSGPYEGYFPITPGTAFGQPVRAIYVGTAGTLALTNQIGQTVTFLGVPVGIFPVAAVAVGGASTALGLIGLY